MSDDRIQSESDVDAREALSEDSAPYNGENPSAELGDDFSVVPPRSDPMEKTSSDETMASDERDFESDSTDDESEDTDQSKPLAEIGIPLGRMEEEYPTQEDLTMDWYILKVQSNREDSIADAIRRRVSVAGLDRFFGQIVVPSEKVTEFKAGKKKVVRRKLYPGYILAQMAINDDTWFLVRDTPGVGDFTGAGGKPTPMLAHEVQRILHTQEEKTDETPKLKISFNIGDRVKINEGTFENFEGEVSGIDEASGRVTVMINIFGRSTPVELEYWQVENV